MEKRGDSALLFERIVLNARSDGTLIQKELGFVPQYDLKTGWGETIREMRGKDSFEF